MKFFGGKSNSVIILSLMLVTAIGVITFGSSNKNDELVREVINDMSPSTAYELLRYEAGQSILLSKGRLGNFYTCLANYRSASTRKASHEGKVERRQLLLKGNIALDLSVVDGEAYMFSIGLKPNSADIYAINCDLSLLIDKR